MFVGASFNPWQETSEEKQLEALTKGAAQKAICRPALAGCVFDRHSHPFYILYQFPSSRERDSPNPAGRIWYEASV